MAADNSREVTILSMNDIPSRDPKRVGRIDTMIFYRIGRYQTGNVTHPKEKLSEKVIEDLIKKDVEVKAKYTGLKFNV